MHTAGKAGVENFQYHYQFIVARLLRLKVTDQSFDQHSHQPRRSLYARDAPRLHPAPAKAQKQVCIVHKNAPSKTAKATLAGIKPRQLSQAASTSSSSWLPTPPAAPTSSSSPLSRALVYSLPRGPLRLLLGHAQAHLLLFLKIPRRGFHV